MTPLLRGAPFVLLLVVSCGDRLGSSDPPGEESQPGVSSTGIMSLAEYRQKFPGPPVPYSFLISRGEQRLRYFGMPHSSDPANPALTSLEERWREFVAATKGEKRVALVEGRVRRLGATREEALSRGGGEGGLLTFLAAGDGVPIESPEPKWSDLFGAQVAVFGRDTVCHAYYLRSLVLAHRNGVAVTIGARVDGGGPLSGLGCDLDPAGLRSVHDKLYGRSIDSLIGDEGVLRQLTDPAGPGPVSRVLANDAVLRDGAIVKNIQRRWRAGQSIFALYGVAHVRMQEPALRRILSPGSGL